MAYQTIEKTGGEPYHPLKSCENMESYIPPDPLIPKRYTPILQAIKAYGNRYAIMGGFGSCLFEKSYNLRGLGNLPPDFYRKPDAVMKIFERIVRHRVEQTKIIVDMEIDILYIGEDYGMQTGLMLSSILCRKMVNPYLKGILDVPGNKGLPIFIHSCGNVRAILGDLIEVGVSILNPMRPKALDLGINSASSAP